MMLSLAAAVLYATLGLLLFRLLRVGQRAHVLPPGPPTIALFGNLHQIPKKAVHHKFLEWTKTYGGIFSLKFGPATTVVISDRRLVKEMLDKRGGIYSSRPASYMLNDLIMRGHNLLVMPYGDKWRHFRKLITQHISEARVEKDYMDIVHAESTQMVHDLMTKPEAFLDHFGRYSNSVIMSLAYGFRTPSIESRRMQQLYELMKKWSIAQEMNLLIPIDLIPSLKWVPESWLDNWKTHCQQIGHFVSMFYDQMMKEVRRRRQNGKKSACFMDKVMDQESHKLTCEELNYLGGVLMKGGSDTTAGVLRLVIQAMVKYPEVQRKAHQQIDSAIPENRLPCLEDRDQLPYIMQIEKEALRWRPIAPIGVPRATTVDDTIDGYLIPKDTTIILNMWALHMTAQPNEPDPSIFEPNRYTGRTKLANEYAVSADYEKRDHYAYGSGRRLCPGIHLAERSLFVSIAKLLWAFEFREIEGKPVDCDPLTGYSNGLLQTAKPFECLIKVRGEERKETILKEFEAAQEIFTMFEG